MTNNYKKYIILITYLLINTLMISFFGRSSWKLWTYSKAQLAKKLWISMINLNKIFKLEAENYTYHRKKNKLEVTKDMKLYWWTPIFNGAFDQRNKFRPESWEYLVKKYWAEYWFNFDPNR